MRNASGSIAALLVLAALAGLAGPALCGSTRAAAMPCCETRGDCEAGLGRPSCCVHLPADAGPGSQTASSAPTTSAQFSVLAANLTPRLGQDSTAVVGVAFPTCSPSFVLLHAILLC